MSAVKKLKFEPTPEQKEATVSAINVLDYDLATAIRSRELILNERDLRFLVDCFYQVQEDRKRVDNQARSKEGLEPGKLAEYFGWQFGRFEKQITHALAAWVDGDPLSTWATSQVGVGTVIAAGLRAHIDLKRCPTVGHIWSFAGLDGTKKQFGAVWAKDTVAEVVGKSKSVNAEHWAALEKVSRRKASNILGLLERVYPGEKVTRTNLTKTLARCPYNAQLKTLCWKLGDCFVKVSNKPEARYGKFYQVRKAFEFERNERGVNRELALTLAEKVGKSTEAYKHNMEGKLSPGHIDARARRWAVKLFLAHWFEEGCRLVRGHEPPNPYPIQHLGHIHWVKSEGTTVEAEGGLSCERTA